MGVGGGVVWWVGVGAGRQGRGWWGRNQSLGVGQMVGKGVPGGSPETEEGKVVWGRAGLAGVGWGGGGACRGRWGSPVVGRAGNQVPKAGSQPR